MRKGKLVISQKTIVIADCDLIYFRLKYNWDVYNFHLVLA